MKHRIATFGFGILLAAAIAYTSTLSTQHKHALHTQGILHPWLHFLGFALLAYLLVGATRSQAVKIILFIALLLFGWATEEHESGKHGWPIEINDVHTDELGVTLGFVAALLRSRAQRGSQLTP